jgi:heme/copper-type cytochrome/quinol oxidase subunit 2
MNPKRPLTSTVATKILWRRFVVLMVILITLAAGVIGLQVYISTQKHGANNKQEKTSVDKDRINAKENLMPGTTDLRTTD